MNARCLFCITFFSENFWYVLGAVEYRGLGISKWSVLHHGNKAIRRIQTPIKELTCHIRDTSRILSRNLLRINMVTVSDNRVLLCKWNQITLTYCCFSSIWSRRRSKSISGDLRRLEREFYMPCGALKGNCSLHRILLQWNQLVCCQTYFPVSERKIVYRCQRTEDVLIVCLLRDNGSAFCEHMTKTLVLKSTSLFCSLMRYQSRYRSYWQKNSLFCYQRLCQVNWHNRLQEPETFFRNYDHKESKTHCVPCLSHCFSSNF